VVITGAIDELLMLGADAPSVFRLFALRHRRDQMLVAFDHRIVAIRNCFCTHATGFKRRAVRPQDQFILASKTIAKVAPGAKVGAFPVIIEPLSDIPKGSLSSAPISSSSSGVVAVAHVVPENMLFAT
jgi:hypothetical protein